MYLLDTNVLSALRRPEKADPGVKAWAERIPASDFFLSAISVLEIERGALMVARRDPRQGRMLRAWIDNHVLGAFMGRVLAVDQAVALHCARLHIPDPRPERDALIAATALVHDLTVVTRNIADFEATGVPLLNPWEP